jgi:hypothetical protein
MCVSADQKGMPCAHDGSTWAVACALAGLLAVWPACCCTAWHAMLEHATHLVLLGLAGCLPSDHLPAWAEEGTLLACTASGTVSASQPVHAQPRAGLPIMPRCLRP